VPVIVAETNIEESDLPMLAGKNQKLANVARKRPVLATLCCLLLVFSLGGLLFPHRLMFSRTSLNCLL